MNVEIMCNVNLEECLMLANKLEKTHN